MSPWSLTDKQNAGAEAEGGTGSHKKDGQGLPETCQHSTRTLVQYALILPGSLQTHQSNGGSRPEDEDELEFEPELDVDVDVEVELSRLLEELLLLLVVIVISLSVSVQSRTSDE